MKIQRIAVFVMDGRGGNPAGVVVAPQLPSDQEMLRIAGEVGYSETAFAARNADAWDTRYFSPESEVPFCGHATIALGAALAGEYGDGAYELALRQGRISVEARAEGNQGYSTLRSPPTRSSAVPGDMLDDALRIFGYAREDLDRDLPAMLANGGSQHLIIPLCSRSILARMDYELDAGRIFMRRHGLVTAAFVWRESARVFHARNAFASGGVLEDPATGAAAAALAGMLRDQRWLSEGDLTVYQGHDMGSPSRIDVSFSGPAGAPVSVGGASALIAGTVAGE
ncbi:MAG TPA: PhzF family phenazine biosynthesis protein [Castellaniella sp.]|nr:PhzF family phenazine biosynthesis protein [Castellaniella sp.]